MNANERPYMTMFPMTNALVNGRRVVRGFLEDWQKFFFVNFEKKDFVEFWELPWVNFVLIWVLIVLERFDLVENLLNIFFLYFIYELIY